MLPCECSGALARRRPRVKGCGQFRLAYNANGVALERAVLAQTYSDASRALPPQARSW